MNLREFYQEAQGDYEETLGRIMKEERVTKYLTKFAASEPVMAIEKALESKDYETAFREAHNLKGVCLNLGLDSLHMVSSDLTESLRNGPTGDVNSFLERVKQEYDRISSLIQQIEG